MMFRAFKAADQTSSRERAVRYQESAAYKAVALPYRGSSISAVAVLPSEAAVKHAGSLAAAVAGLNVSELLDGSKYRRVPPQGLQLHLPRFTVKSECVSLKEVRESGLALEQLGGGPGGASGLSTLAARPGKCPQAAQADTPRASRPALPPCSTSKRWASGARLTRAAPGLTSCPQTRSTSATCCSRCVCRLLSRWGNGVCTCCASILIQAVPRGAAGLPSVWRVGTPQVCVVVDEEGTEAAAVTVMCMVHCAAIMTAKPVVIKLDRCVCRRAGAAS